MSRDPRLYLEDILEACEKILQYIEGISREDLTTDTMRLDALVRNIEILGEAAKNLPEEVKAKIPNLPWREITAMRDVLAHAYFGVDHDIVWDVATTKVESVRRLVSEYLHQSSTD